MSGPGERFSLVTSAPAVANLSVRPIRGGQQEGLLEATIETPVEGGTSDAWAVRVRGHVLGADGPVQEVEAVVPGLVVASGRPALPSPEVAARHPDLPWAAECGFTLLVNTLILRPNFEFRLRATFADGSREKVALISGQRRPLETGYTPRLQPLLVNSFGRTGTTLLMRMLCGPSRGGGLPAAALRGPRRQVLAARAQDARRPHRCHQAGRRPDGVPPRAAGRRRQPLLLRRLCRLAGGRSLVRLDLRHRARRLLPAQHRRLVPGHRGGAGGGRRRPRLLCREALSGCLPAADARAVSGKRGSCFWSGTSAT